ncbi:MAG: hypothetical protein ACPGYT_07490 [Nitrospirales bacterium]
MKMPFILTAFFLFHMGLTFAGDRHLPPYKGSEAFESLKSLEGTWTGTHQMGEKEEPVTIEYKVSSNGSTLIETFFPGHKHEMISVYHDKDGKLSMTHYCSIGNQPELDLVSTDGNAMEFSLSKQAHINVSTEGHMHGLTMTRVDNDHIVHNWTMYQKEKNGGQTTMKLARVQ